MFSTSTRTPIGLDIGRRFIKAVQLRGNELVAAACIRRTGNGAMLDPGEAKQLAEAVCRRPFQGRAVIAAVPHDKLLTSIVELPPRASGAPIEQLARSELARIHHKDAHCLEMAHWELPASAHASARTMVMATACPQDDAEAMLDCLEAEGLDVLALDVPAAAAMRACGPLIEDAGSGAVLDVGWGASRLVLQYKGSIVYERSLDRCGLDAWGRMFAQNRGGDLDAAEAILMDGQIGNHSSAQGAANNHEHARKTLVAHLEQLAAEMRTPLRYLTTQYTDTVVQNLFVIGGGAALPDLDNMLGMKLEMKVKSVSPMELVKCPAAIEAVCGAWLTPAIGLARYPEQ
jgi:Tfp pilus assembly PilM family ATPase